MIVRVAQRVSGLQMNGQTLRVVVACDSPDVRQACHAHGVQALLTRNDHVSGSDRLAEACDLLNLPDDDIVVNVQGDEPLMDPSLVLAVASCLVDEPRASMGTAAHAIASAEDFQNPNVVKVVLDRQGLALYFSRAPIPHARDHGHGDWWNLASTPVAAPLRHIGIYSYRVGYLREFARLAPAPLEQTEALEQLRALWHGARIAVHVSATIPGAGVDTPEDLERVRRLIN